MYAQRTGLLPVHLLALAALVAASLFVGMPEASADSDRTVKTVAVRDGTWHVRKSLSGGSADRTFSYGQASDTKIIGDWNGSGQPTPGVVRGSRFYLNNSLGGGAADRSFSYGRSGDVPLVGDWNGDGSETIGVVRGNRFFLRNSNSGGAADVSFQFGRSGDVPVVGDWNGDGTDTIGVVRGSTFHLRNSLSGGVAHETFSFGRTGDSPVTGDWNANGTDTVGVVRGNSYLLTNAHRGGTADLEFTYGARDDDPLVWSAEDEQEPASTTADAPSEPRGVWDRLAQCESNENWQANTGNGYYGGLQFHPQTWASHGGHEYASNAHLASREQEIVIARRVLETQGWPAWPACSRIIGVR